MSIGAYSLAPAPGQGAQRRLDCDDASGDDTEVNLTADSETYTCKVVDEFGNPISGAAIDGENMGGANDPDDAALPSATNTTNDYGPPQGNNWRCGDLQRDRRAFRGPERRGRNLLLDRLRQ